MTSAPDRFLTSDGRARIRAGLEELRRQLGSRLSTVQTVREQHARGEALDVGAPPDAVVWPESTSEVSSIVRLCHEQDVPVVPFGAGTSLEGHVSAPYGGICIDLSRMNAVLALHQDDFDCVVQPGITRSQLNEYLGPLFVGQMGVVMADVAAGIWSAPVLTRDHGLMPSGFAAAMGLAVLLPGMAGSIIGGIAADLGLRSGRRGGILYGAVTAAVIAVPAALFPLASGLTGFACALGVLLLCGNVTGLVTATVLASIIPNQMRGVCLGAFIVVSSVIGMGVAPTAVTLVSGLFGGESQLAPALAWTGVAFSAIALAAFVQAMRRLPDIAPRT